MSNHIGKEMERMRLAWDLAETDTERALANARAIGRSWTRCRLLSRAAQFITDPDLREQVLREAFAAARETGEPNRIVTASRWPLSVLLDIGDTGFFALEVERMLAVIRQEPHPIRRQDALSCIMFPNAPRQWLDRVFEAFCEACLEGQKYLTMRRAAQKINEVDHERALRIALMIRHPRERRRTLRLIGEGARSLEGGCNGDR